MTDVIGEKDFSVDPRREASISFLHLTNTYKLGGWAKHITIRDGVVKAKKIWVSNAHRQIEENNYGQED